MREKLVRFSNEFNNIIIYKKDKALVEFLTRNVLLILIRHIYNNCLEMVAFLALLSYGVVVERV